MVLKLLPFSGEPEVFTPFKSVLLYKVSPWFGNGEMSDFTSEGSEPCTFVPAQEKARPTPAVLKFPLNSERVLYIRICHLTTTEDSEGLKM